MPKRIYRSKTQWIGQPRDSRGRWGKIGSAIASPFKKTASGVANLGKAFARAKGIDMGYGINPYKATVGGYVTHTKSIGKGFAISSRTETRVHPIGKSPFEKVVNKGYEAGLNSIGNSKAQTVARAILNKPKNDNRAGYRIQKGMIRSRTKKEIEGAQNRRAAKKAKKLKRLEASRGVPSTITGQSKAKRPARRRK